MNYPSIRIEGAILSPDILGRIEELPGQKPADFGLDSSVKVKDEIARAWADAQDYWRIFQRKLEMLKPDSPATTETRQQWVVPLLALLGYQIEYQARSTELNGKLYTISHRATNRAQAPVQIVGYREPAGLDRKPANAAVRMSAHAVVQEFINLNEQLYGIVTNGRVLRLLRNSSRLIKLSYLEFDLDRIFTDGLFSDFAILYRLLHATRMPLTNESATESWIERYHLDSLDSGARIREGLSRAVESAIRDFANGFLKHPENTVLREAVASNSLAAADYYKNLLRLIYRLLFLMVIEERDLVFPPAAGKTLRDIYRNYYSVHRLRLLSEHRYLADHRRHDLWLSVRSTFRLFEADGPGQKLGVAPLAGDLFGEEAIRHIAGCTLGNDVLLGCVRALNVYEHPENHQLIRVNYAALNVEEFGSVYEGLLEYKPTFHVHGNDIEFAFEQGDERAATGSHYTPEDLVQPLIKHSLDYLIAERLKAPNPEAELLDLRVTDITCGSGHILLAAARRIATELAVVRTGEEQPSPSAYRAAVRDVIRTCIYGVDLNPLAVELCKVALWLEAHNPGQPLNFLDHHIKCGNAIVGFVRREELDKGVPNEAFATMPGDDKDLAAKWRKANKQDRADIRQIRLAPPMQQRLEGRLTQWNVLSALPERTPAEIEAKKDRFLAFTQGNDAFLFTQLAAIPIAQFYVPKTPDNDTGLITDSQFRRYWTDGLAPQGEGTAMALATAIEKRFFHWFLEFPDIIARGGFDCILGNPPYLGDKALSGTYGHAFCSYVKVEFATNGLADLVVYFLRRMFGLVAPMGFTAFITTNSIKDGDIRKDGLERVMAEGGEINMAVRGIKWPGRANLVVSLVSIHKGAWKGNVVLDGKRVSVISPFLDSSLDLGEPKPLAESKNHVFNGYYWLGDGFLISNEAADLLRKTDSRNAGVIGGVVNGHEINSEPDQSPQRSAIFFADMNEAECRTFAEPFEIIERTVKPERLLSTDRTFREKWWRFARTRPELRRSLKGLARCFAAANTTKYLSFSSFSTDLLISHPQNVFATDRWDLYAVVQSTIHEVWARKYSGALETRLRYSPSDCFETFAFPEGLWQTANPALAAIGERYHEHRKSLMLSLWLGLTDIYNLFHSRDLTPARVAKVSKKPAEEAARGYEGILELRRLHVELDLAIRDAYGWQNLPLDHDFHEVDTLPENDRVRSTISSAARKEVLRRLLALNHARAEAEKAEAKATKPKRGKKPLSPDDEPIQMFGEGS
jgi:methylase of polypeptide subunit release factors